jgi:hypothetical protein
MNYATVDRINGAYLSPFRRFLLNDLRRVMFSSSPKALNVGALTGTRQGRKTLHPIGTHYWFVVTGTVHSVC